MEVELKKAVASQSSFYHANINDVSDYQSRMKKVRQKKEPFGSQTIDINNYIVSPTGLEGMMFSLYFLLIPYLVGVLFLFLFIAQVAFEKLILLDLSSLFVVWMIGYEVLAVSLLTIIFFSYIKYLYKD